MCATMLIVEIKTFQHESGFERLYSQQRKLYINLPAHSMDYICKGKSVKAAVTLMERTEWNKEEKTMVPNLSYLGLLWTLANSELILSWKGEDCCLMPGISTIE